MSFERSMSLGRNEIDSLKETLQAQQELLQKLYNELDEERESSATAADEALSMIVRLQGEKAAVEMEGSQYKRIAEQKMCHAQEMLEMFQELIYQKEMQIASLEFQVQVYKFKLQSLGFHDLGVSEVQYPDYMLSKSVQGSLRRGSSLPPPILDALSRRASSEGDKSAYSSPKPSPIRRENTSAVDFNLFWEDIKKLDERVKGLADVKAVDDSNSVHTLEETANGNANGNGISGSRSLNPSEENSPAKSMLLNKDSEKVFDVQPCGESPCSIKVQDIFEVPQCLEQQESGVTHNAQEKIDWEKKPLLSSDSSTDSPRKSNDQTKPQEGKTRRKSMLFKHPTFAVADLELQQLNRRLKQLENGRFVTKLVESGSETESEELRLLREIREKVDSMQAEITGLRTKKPPREDHSVGCLREAMLCFLP